MYKFKYVDMWETLVQGSGWGRYHVCPRTPHRFPTYVQHVRYMFTDPSIAGRKTIAGTVFLRLGFRGVRQWAPPKTRRLFFVDLGGAPSLHGTARGAAVLPY